MFGKEFNSSNDRKGVVLPEPIKTEFGDAIILPPRINLDRNNTAYLELIDPERAPDSSLLDRFQLRFGGKKSREAGFIEIHESFGLFREELSTNGTGEYELVVNLNIRPESDEELYHPLVEITKKDSKIQSRLELIEHYSETNLNSFMSVTWYDEEYRDTFAEFTESELPQLRIFCFKNDPYNPE